jgi:hypothetical protein
MNKQTSKLQTALIETGKEIEALKETPGLATIQDQCIELQVAMKKENMKATRKEGRKLCAMVIKYMIEKL